MHPRLATRRLEVLDIQLEDHRAALLGWLDTVDTHLYRLYLMTGKGDYLTVLQVVDRLRDEALKASALNQIPHSVLLELVGQLNSIATPLLKASGSDQ